MSGNCFNVIILQNYKHLAVLVQNEEEEVEECMIEECLRAFIGLE